MKTLTGLFACLILFSLEAGANTPAGEKEGADPKMAHAYLRLAYGYFKNRRYEKSLENLRKAAEYDPEDPEIIHGLGVVLFELGRREEAEVEFNRALEYSLQKEGDYDMESRARESIYFAKEWKRRKRNKKLAYLAIALCSIFVAGAGFFIIRQFARFFIATKPIK